MKPDQRCSTQSFDIDPLLTEKESAQVLSTTEPSLKQSRYTGRLFGRAAPSFIKMGRSARYKLSELLRFIDQFPEYQNTSQYPAEPSGCGLLEYKKIAHYQKSTSPQIEKDQDFVKLNEGRTPQLRQEIAGLDQLRAKK